MNNKTIAASKSAPTIGGVLAGAERTMAAPSTRRSATSPAYYLGRPASFWLRALSPVAPAPEYSKSFQLTNACYGVTLELVGVEGEHEGVPPIGSTMAPGQGQNFEVQYLAAGTGNVWATYQVIHSIHGFVGTVQIQMSYGASGETTTTIAVNNSAIRMSLGGSPTDTIIQTGSQRRVAMTWSFK